MEVILREDITSVGKVGEVVQVRDGFARNFLLPQGKAVLADVKNLKELEHHKKAALQTQAKLKKQAEELSLRIGSLNLVIKKDAGEDGRLFGSVGSKDIVELLRKEKINVDRKQIHLEQPFKQLGEYEVPIKLAVGVSANLKLSIIV